MDKSLIALLLLLPTLALAQTHTMPGSNVVPSGANLTIQSGGSIIASPGSTVTGFGGGGGSGTVTSLTATAPIVVTPTPLTTTGVISITGAALTKTDDTNVTLTLGGTPATALLQAASITAGWTGTLAIARGGTGAATVAANTVFGNNTGSTAAPGFQTLVDAQVPNTLTLTAASNLTTNGFVKTSGSNGTLSVDTTAAYEVPLTFSTGLTRATNTVTVNTSQNIATLSNLTTNGFVKTGSGVGTLSVDTATYQASDADLTTWAGITPGTGVGTFLATPNSANLRSAVTDETGTSGGLVFAGSPTITTPTIAALANLTTNGFVKTSGGVGTLSVDTTAYEPALGNPSTNGYVLSSTTGGTRSWIAPGGGGGTTFIGLTDVPASYIGSNGKVVAVNSGATALEFVTAPAAGAGGSNTQVQYNDSSVLGGDANFTWDKTIPKLTLSGAATTDSRFKVGTLEFQPYGLGNAWFGENAYFDGAAFRRRATGAAGLFYFLGTEGQFLFYPSAAAGTSLGSNIQAKFSADGSVALGGNINGSAGNYTNSLLLVKGGSAQIGVAANYAFGWTITSTDASATMDTGFSRNTAGVVEVNNGTAGTYRDLKADEVNAVTGFQVNSLAPANYELTGNGTDFVAKASDIPNGSSAQQTGFASNTYLTGSVVTINAGDFKVGATYRCLFDMTKTTAGTAAPVITIYIGTNGSTADTAAQTITFAVATGVADTGIFEVWVNFRAVGASATIASHGRCTHNLAATGLTSTGAAGDGHISNSTSSTFNSTAATKIGIAFNGGASYAGTCNIVQAFYQNP